MLQRGSPDQTLGHALGVPACLLYVFSLFCLLCSVFEELQAESPDCSVQEFHIGSGSLASLHVLEVCEHWVQASSGQPPAGAEEQCRVQSVLSSSPQTSPVPIVYPWLLHLFLHSLVPIICHLEPPALEAL